MDYILVSHSTHFGSKVLSVHFRKKNKDTAHNKCAALVSQRRGLNRSTRLTHAQNTLKTLKTQRGTVGATSKCAGDPGSKYIENLETQRDILWEGGQNREKQRATSDIIFINGLMLLTFDFDYFEQTLTKYVLSNSSCTLQNMYPTSFTIIRYRKMLPMIAWKCSKRYFQGLVCVFLMNNGQWVARNIFVSLYRFKMWFSSFSLFKLVLRSF